MTNDRIKHIDGLRALAVLSVVIFHAAKYDPGITHASSSLASFLLRQGCHGVDLFFVISGFCLAYPILARLHERHEATLDIVRYSARRLARIVPPYYAAILLLLGLALLLRSLGITLNSQTALPAGFSAIDVLKQALFLDKNVLLLNGSFWTLAVEFRWYFLFPILLWVWTRSPRAFAIIAISSLLLMSTRAGSIDIFVLPAFMLGIVASHLYVTRSSVVRSALPSFFVLLPIAIIASPTTNWNWSTSAIWQLTFFSLVVAAGEIKQMRTMLSTRYLVMIGTASYGIYLIHEPIIVLLEQQLLFTGAIACFSVSAFVCVVTGLGFSWIAERPFIETSAREWLIRELEQALSKWFAVSGIGRALRLEAPDRTTPHGLQLYPAVRPIEHGIHQHR